MECFLPSSCSDRRHAASGHDDPPRFVATSVDAQQSGLKLHQQVILCGPTIDTHFGQRQPRVAPHGVKEIGHLMGNRFNRGSSNMGDGCAASQANDHPPSMRIPVGGSQSGKGGNERNSTAIRDRTRQGFDFGRRMNCPQPVPQPLHDCTADEDTPFEGIRFFSLRRCGDRGDQAILRSDRRLAGVLQLEAARSVGGFGFATFDTVLPEEGRLLVPRQSGNRDRCTEQAGGRFPDDTTAITDFGEECAGDLEEPQQFVIPLAGVNVQDQCSRGIRDIGDVTPACG